jgi:hypothetical protein
VLRKGTVHRALGILHLTGFTLKVFTLYTLFCGLSVDKLISQTLPVSNPLVQDYFRLKQLSGEVDTRVSLSVKPFAASFLDSTSEHSEINYAGKDVLKGPDIFKVRVLPISLDQQFNSSTAYGWNDGLMIPAKGYQQYISAGIFIKAGPLQIQALPEFVYAANPEYLTGNDKTGSDRHTSYIALNDYGADLPPYYEAPNFSTFGIGQSSIRLNFGPGSIGISNENLWWGPGRRNSLLMGNNARGFKHLALNTTRPIHTPLGSFEGQIIAGRLENSNSTLNDFKLDEWRYLSGMVISYQPKWVPGLSVGLTRAFQIYNSDIKGFGDYMPLFQSFEKKKTNEDYTRRDQITSVFARYLFTEAHAEVYAELARNDHSFDIRDFVQEPQHSRAYLVGFQKLVPLAGAGEGFLIGAELTHLAQPLNRVLRSSGTWYVHNINQGYTHLGEVLGAGTGPGGNLQSLELSWVKGIRKIGFQVERYEHNRDYYQQMIDPDDNYNENWTDLSGAFLTNWNFKNLLVRGKLAGVQSFNYQWQTGIDDLPKRNLFNVHANLGLYYYFK